MNLFQNILLYLYYPIIYTVKIKDYNNNFPERYILACNHPNKIDGFLLWIIFFFKFNTKLKIFAYEKYFYKRIIGFHLKSVECIKVTREDPKKSLEEAFKIKDKSFCFFIEGRKTKKKIKAKTGFIRLSKYHNIPIIPIRIINNLFYKKIIIGKPIKLNIKRDLHKESQIVLNKIYNLN